jgi:protein-S-isoprenylcysteine O-methyltransferase Ste14
MDAHSRRRPRRTRWTPAILFAAVALTVLAVAGPAVARPAHMAHAHGATLSVAATVAILAIAACIALALLLLAFFTGRRDTEDRVTQIGTPQRVRHHDRERAAAA